MINLQICPIRENFLIKLNNCRNEINTKFKEISDNLIIRQNQLLAELDGFENKYSESLNAANLLRQSEKHRNDQIKALKGDSFLLGDLISLTEQIIEGLESRIADLRHKLVNFTNIDIELDTDNINTMIDKLGSVALTKDSEYNSCVDYITDMCHIDPCESYNPKDNTIGKKREEGNNISNKFPIKGIACIPETGILNTQYSSSEQSMPQHNTPFILNKNECSVDHTPYVPVILRMKNYILPGTTTNVVTDNQAKSRRQAVCYKTASVEVTDLKQFSKKDVDTRVRSRSTNSYLEDTYYAAGAEATAPNQDVNYRSARPQYGEFLIRNNKRENSEFEAFCEYDVYPLSPTLPTSSFNNRLKCSNEDNVYVEMTRIARPRVSSNDGDLTLQGTDVYTCTNKQYVNVNQSTKVRKKGHATIELEADCKYYKRQY